ncbi:MAG: hypothetical protein JKY53_14845, partial [Flavobacteriales bacterium]|nr:hypothetical protein [Flavobacteriales bacterium]
MKIEITKVCEFSHKTWKVGERATVESGLGTSLVDEGKAKSQEYVSTREIHAAAISIEKAHEILEELPRKSKDIIKSIKT